MKKKKKMGLPKSKKDQDDELEALFETFDKQFKDIEEKLQHIEKEVHPGKSDEENSDSMGGVTGKKS